MKLIFVLVHLQPVQAPVPVMMQMPMRPPPQMVVPAQHVYMAPAPQIAPAPFGVMPQMPPDMTMEEPPNKRARGEDNLMPEADFLARNVSPVTFRVLVPAAADKPEWKLNGKCSLSLCPWAIRFRWWKLKSTMKPECRRENKNCKWKIFSSRIPTLWPFIIFILILLCTCKLRNVEAVKNKSAFLQGLWQNSSFMLQINCILAVLFTKIHTSMKQFSGTK